MAFFLFGKYIHWNWLVESFRKKGWWWSSHKDKWYRKSCPLHSLMTPGYLFNRMKWFSAIFLANQEFYGESGNGESSNWIVSLIWRGETSWIITITTDTLYSLVNGSKWSMHRLYCELVLVWRDYLGKRTRRTYWSTWNGGDGGLEYETVVVWLVVDGWLLWEWDETLWNWSICVREYARHKI